MKTMKTTTPIYHDSITDGLIYVCLEKLSFNTMIKLFDPSGSSDISGSVREPVLFCFHKKTDKKWFNFQQPENKVISSFCVLQCLSLPVVYFQFL